MDSSLVKSLASEHGFQECRIAAAGDTTTYSALVEWLEEGRAGEMHYIADRLTAYQNPSYVMPHTRSVLMLVTSYNCTSADGTAIVSEDDKRAEAGKVAKYAQGGVDYHDVLHRRMKTFIAALRERFVAGTFRGVVDTAPLLEREFAQRSGLGWAGKNTMLISRTWGSFFFLSAILSSIEFEPDQPFVADHCGTCTACLDACPTGAIKSPRVLDARDCISYHTIESPSLAPINQRAQIGDWLFGCDICQDVCPWNRKARKVNDSVFAPSADFSYINISEILQMEADEFRRRFRKTPLWRSKLSGLQRNAILVAGNLKLRSLMTLLEPFLEDENPTLREAARWALTQLNA